jgi:hypothetical protein
MKSAFALQQRIEISGVYRLQAPYFLHEHSPFVPANDRTAGAETRRLRRISAAQASNRVQRTFPIEAG